MSRSCRSCGRPYRSSRRGHYHRRQRTVFSQGWFWTWVLVILAVIWIYGAVRGQS